MTINRACHWIKREVPGLGPFLSGVDVATNGTGRKITADDDVVTRGKQRSVISEHDITTLTEYAITKHAASN
jgi:hypothetical protein